MPLPYAHYQTHLHTNSNPSLHKSPSQTNPAQYHRLSSANNHHLRVPHHPMRGTVISDISFESGLSDDYALPPDAVSESTCPMDASMPSLLMRQSYVDSPSKKLESLEKVSVKCLENLKLEISICMSFVLGRSSGQTGRQIKDLAQTLVCPEEWLADLLEEPARC